MGMGGEIFLLILSVVLDWKEIDESDVEVTYILLDLLIYLFGEGFCSYDLDEFFDGSFFVRSTINFQFAIFSSTLSGRTLV